MFNYWGNLELVERPFDVARGRLTGNGGVWLNFNNNNGEPQGVSLKKFKTITLGALMLAAGAAGCVKNNANRLSVLFINNVNAETDPCG